MSEKHSEQSEEQKPIIPENLPDLPKNKVQGILQELEILALTKSRGGSGGIDMSQFSPQQVDKLLDILSKNEDNAFSFHKERLNVAKEVELKRIDSTTVNQKTIRITIIIILIVIPAITIAILFYKDTFFIPWLTFLTGLAGGVGLSKASKFLTRELSPSPLVSEDEN